MAQTVRPLSPHLGVYRWQVQMVTSILHRATGIALSVGLLVVTWGLVALASGESAWRDFTACADSVIGIILLVGWTWSFFYHLCNGIRHLLQDAGLGYQIHSRAKLNVNQATFVRSSWMSVIFSLILTIVAWVYVWQGVAA
ncbi:MAG TPA: succinate dehydrogenase, cytochrome b556 subunit [Oleiagrimonas sp.]|nr:succinate dehydrogenase, cytochrome b556 subunit [Oleiagrimonas sp.]HET7299589.1 succinate dehydrogenase, cytochrome b556 subunit [Oleiagrimonas sp.]